MTDSHNAARRLRLAAIPDLARPVGIHGTLRHAEVGGAICFGIAVAMATYATN